jgi:uncharacterized FlaG/YvyC family protein
MKIDGIDPLLLNRIKEQTDRMEIQKSESIGSDNAVRRESSSQRGKAAIPLHNEQKMNEVLKRLNDEAERDNSPLRFSVRRDAKLWHVEVTDTLRNEVVRDIPTDQALTVLNRIQSLFGVLLDEKR